MTRARHYVAVDLGAESGRVMLGSFDGSRLALTEAHRFENRPVHVLDTAGDVNLHWDILRLFAETREGLGRAAAGCEGQLASLGLDSWAVDFGLLDARGTLLGNPHHYRDGRTDGMLDEAYSRIPRQEIFERTGIQFLQINTLYQLLSMALTRSPALGIAEKLLMIPDLLNYWLTGTAVCEYTNATTTQCYDPRAQAWSSPLLERMGIPEQIFPDVVPPGTILGPLAAHWANDLGLPAVSVVAPATHDTGSAAVAVPADRPGFAWISSGTWSVVGAETRQPVIDEKSLAYNFTNEGGVCGTFRLLRNVTGLWLLQECRRAWVREGEELSHGDLIGLARSAEPFQVVIDPDNAEFFKPGDMPARIRSYCRLTHQPVPTTRGAIVRGVLEGIALKYRYALGRLEELIGTRLDPIYVVGGGSQNQLLNEFTAAATGRQVIAGPAEATAIGNILVQAMTRGDLGSLEEARALVRESFSPTVVEPTAACEWDAAYDTLLNLIAEAA